MPRIAFHTLGCKVNQYESEKMVEALVQDGFDVVDFGEEADVYVVNSCTVTVTADSKSRQAARAVARRNPGAMVVLTGCYAETSTDQAREIQGVSLVLGNNEKPGIVEHIRGKLPANISVAGSVATRPRGRTRALLKIQDGCDQFCSYCAVPLARPVMSSRPASEVLGEAKALAERGHREIVLTGIRLGSYDGGADLTGLLRSLVGIEGIERIRLSSIEFTDAPDGLLDLMAAEEKLCPHLHLPLQSGSDDVLRRMNRPYSVVQFERFVDDARRCTPDIAVTTDLMVGFPGETEEEFRTTCRFVEKMQFARAHVFRYSPRPGTAAAGMKDDVPADEKKRRSDMLIELAARQSKEYARRFIGRTMRVLVEGGDGRQSRPGSNGGSRAASKGTKLQCGMTDNYMRVSFSDGSAAPGELVDVRIERAEGNQVLGVRC